MFVVVVSDIMQLLIMVQVINCVLYDVMVVDEWVLVFGEDVVVEGGVFWVIEGLVDMFGVDWCFDMLLVEFVIIGIVVGLVLCGFVLVLEIQFDGFFYLVFD